jgi:hypothetical protein
MTLRHLLTFVSCGCIYTSYASRYRRTKGAAAQRCPSIASAWLVAFPNCSATLEGMFAFVSSGVSVYRAGSAANTTRPRQPSQDRFHGQIAILAGTPAAPSCCSQQDYVERYRQSGPGGRARSRTEAWLTGAQPGDHFRFSGNISSTACSIPSLSKPMKRWFPTNDGLHSNPRR